MYKKYEKKFNPTVIGTRFGDIKDLALERAQEGLLSVGVLNDLVRPILDAHGIAGGQRATYLAFARTLWKRSLRKSGEALKKEAVGLKARFVQSYGLDPEILDEIIKAVIPGVIPY